MSNKVATKITKAGIVSVQELASVLFNTVNGESQVNRDLPDQGTKILDTSSGGDASKEAFYGKAIPTARFMNGLQELVDPKGDYPFEFPKEKHVIELLQNTGLNKEDELILYAQPGKLVGSTRTFSVLHAYGLNVKILNGGLLKYIGEGYMTESGEDYSGPITEIDNLDNPKEYLRFLEDMRKFETQEDTTCQVIDSRPKSAFEGNDPSYGDALRQGNIDGSVHVEGNEFLNSDETFKSDEELRAVFEKYNLDPKKDTVFMCRAGVAATFGYAALVGAKPGDFGKALLYDRSWNEYGSVDH